MLFYVIKKARPSRPKSTAMRLHHDCFTLGWRNPGRRWKLVVTEHRTMSHPYQASLLFRCGIRIAKRSSVSREIVSGALKGRIGPFRFGAFR